MKKQTNIHGIKYSIELLNPNTCLVIKHTKKQLTAKTNNVQVYYNVDSLDKYDQIDAKRHLKGLFLI